MPDRGGYTVQPVPVPKSTTLDNNNNEREGGINQKLILFKRGKAMSLEPIIIGTNQFPKPLINIGISIKNIMIKAWPVTMTLYNCEFPIKKQLPGWANSRRIKSE